MASLTTSRHERSESPARAQRAQPTRSQPWYCTTWALALAGSALMFAALPPLDLWPLAWVAPIPWLLLVRQKELTGRRPYFVLWVAGFAFWLAALHWLRLPHWATSFGWLALSFYLAFYVPVFVALTRVAVHRLGVSIIVAASVVWMGLELARAHLLTGFTMGSLGHTQYRWIELIQIADLMGCYGVGFVVMLGAACLARMIPQGDDARWTFWPLPVFAAALIVTLSYGYFRTSGDYTRPGPKIGLIQGSIDTEIKLDPEETPRIFREYYGLSVDALNKQPALDLLVWPETMFPYPLCEVADDYQPPAEQQSNIAKSQAATQEIIAETQRRLGRPLLLGIAMRRFQADGPVRFNSAAFIDDDGKVSGLYSKMHLVMFGEYVPFANLLPWLEKLTPLPGSLEAGESPVSFEIAGARLAPNICYESVIPQLIRRQVNELAAKGAEPDILVNLTNDGWFWGSSQLDMHLVCGVFRAVECRKPFLIAANTGFSAWIDGDGRIVEQGPRRATGVIVADELKLDNRQSPYLRYGDVPAGLCLTACIGLAVFGVWQWKRESRV